MLKKEIHQNRSGVALYSANVRKPFGFVTTANAGGLPYGGALWSMDSDFDCRSVSSGEIYSITDHCGEMKILVPGIDPAYLAAQIRQAGLDYGFNREFRPSLEMIGKLLGHSQMRTTQRYAHLLDSPLRAGVDAVAEAMRARPRLVSA